MGYKLIYLFKLIMYEIKFIKTKYEILYYLYNKNQLITFNIINI